MPPSWGSLTASRLCGSAGVAAGSTCGRSSSCWGRFAAYSEEVRFQCPNAQIVYALFDVVAKYGREVIDRVRVDQANRLRNDRPARQLVKGSRGQVRLQELLQPIGRY